MLRATRATPRTETAAALVTTSLLLLWWTDLLPMNMLLTVGLHAFLVLAIISIACTMRRWILAD
jgi:hypothetical protein